MELVWKWASNPNFISPKFLTKLVKQNVCLVHHSPLYGGTYLICGELVAELPDASDEKPGN